MVHEERSGSPKRWVVFDAEGNGLTPTKFYCLSYKDYEGVQETLTDYQDIRDFFTRYEMYVGHNIRRWDLPNLRRVIGIPGRLAEVADTLAVAWYLDPNRSEHTLESYGEDFGIHKLPIQDWDNLKLSDYIARCERDVEINYALWRDQIQRLLEIYSSEGRSSSTSQQDQTTLYRFLSYLDFKMYSANLAEESRWKLDLSFCRSKHENLCSIRDQKYEELKRRMPKVEVVKEFEPPKRRYNSDGQLGVLGQRWQDRLVKQGLPPEYDGVVREVVSKIEGNPGSHPQIKSWLYSLGWVPQTWKTTRDKKTGETKSVEQIGKPKEKGGGLCESVKLLFEKEPSLELLDGYYVLNHRIALLSGFLRDERDGYLRAAVAGLTNTLRFKHAEIVNLPKPEVPYGSDIRGCLVASSDDTELCGSDMSGLEDRLKQHFIYPYDPDYVAALNSVGYDPHLDIAVLAGGITEEESKWYKEINGLSDAQQVEFWTKNPSLKNEFKRLKTLRSIFKNGNYACQYGAGIPRLMITCGINREDATKLHKAYWDRNWAIKAVSRDARVKTIDGQMWLFNPINSFWYSLRFEKDIFSTLVQGSGAYCFDQYLAHVLAERPQVTGQFHDEFILEVKKGCREEITSFLEGVIEEVNEYLNLNRRLDCEVHFGSRYSDIH